MARIQYSFDFPYSSDALKEALESLIAKKHVTLVDQWVQTRQDCFELKIVWLPQGDPLPYVSNTPTYVKMTWSKTENASKWGVTGERAAEGPIEEYFLLEQLRQLIKETIEALESAPSEWSVFVSYRRDDSDYVADEICRRLQDRFGRRTIFKDTDAIPIGVRFPEYLEQMLSKCEVLLTVIGRDWLAPQEDGLPRIWQDGDYVHTEIATALARKVLVIPILVRGAKMPGRDELPPAIQPLADHNGIKLRQAPDFDADFARLATRLGEVLTKS